MEKMIKEIGELLTRDRCPVCGEKDYTGKKGNREECFACGYHFRRGKLAGKKQVISRAIVVFRQVNKHGRLVIKVHRKIIYCPERRGLTTIRGPCPVITTREKFLDFITTFREQAENMGVESTDTRIEYQHHSVKYQISW